MKHPADEMAEVFQHWKARATAAEAENAKLRAALEPFVSSVIILPTGEIVGLERWHFERARAALETDNG
jgi:hypothetical protein